MKTISLARFYSILVNLDILIYIVWFLLFLLLIGSIILHYYTIVFPSFFANIGIVVFLFFRKQKISKWELDLVEQKTTDNLNNDRTVWVVSVISFFIFYSISLLSLFEVSYTKSVLYYICIAICVAILIFEIYSVRSAIFGYVILLQAFLLSLNIVLSNHLVFIHGISQPDLPLHIFLYEEILNTGHISANTFGFYNVLASHHVFASEIMVLTGYNPRSVYLVLGSVIVAIGVLFVFIIGKRFVNLQYGLIAAVIFTCLDFYLMWGEHPEHVAYCFGFALICFTTILYSYKIRKLAFYLLFVLTTIAMIFTHHLTAVMVFAAVGSLVICDIFHIIETRKLSFPSLYISVVFGLLIFTLLYIISKGQYIPLLQLYFKQYLMKINTVITNIFPAPIPVASVPVTPVPVASVPVASATVTSVPVASATVTSVPYEKLITLPVSPPTGYDRIPLLTLLPNILGSSILVFTAVLGFCTCLKKRSWFGDYAIINAIVISALLALGIVFPIAVFLPDRLYPFLQISSLVFLSAFGIVWLRNAFSTKSRLIVVAGICIIIGGMSFFSLAGIINGFETSPFADNNIAYPKHYTTSQDLAFGEWRTSLIYNDTQKVFALPINKSGIIEINKLPGNKYFIFDRTIEKTGIVKDGLIFGQLSFVRLNNEQLRELDTISQYYDNGLIHMMAKSAPQK